MASPYGLVINPGTSSTHSARKASWLGFSTGSGRVGPVPSGQSSLVGS